MRGLIAAAVLGVVACGSSAEPSESSSSGGGASGQGGSGAGAGGTGAQGSGGSGACAGDPGTGPCAATAECSPVASRCIAFDDPCGKSVSTLRMAEIDFTAPPVMAQGLFADLIRKGVLLDREACNLAGTGTISWLVELDRTVATLKTGAAKPADPTAGYCFVNESIGGVSAVPAISPAPVGADGTFTAETIDTLFLPLYLDAAASDLILLPLSALGISGKLSPDGRCIGAYDDATLSPANACQPDPGQKSFIHAGKVVASISLEDADQVDVTQLGQSLCVLLSGNSAMYGDGAKPISRCKRDAGGKLLFQGDWCTLTDGPAGSGCADAVHVEGTFAASAVAHGAGCPGGA